MNVTAHDIATSRAHLGRLLTSENLPRLRLMYGARPDQGEVVPLFHDQSVFGGEEDETDEAARPSRRTRRERFERLQVRAFLFTNPRTPCAAPEVAEVLGIPD